MKNIIFSGILLMSALSFCTQAQKLGTGLNFGSRSMSAGSVKMGARLATSTSKNSYKHSGTLNSKAVNSLTDKKTNPTSVRKTSTANSSKTRRRQPNTGNMNSKNPTATYRRNITSENM